MCDNKDLTDKQIILLVCNKIRGYFAELYRRQEPDTDWKQDKLFLAFGQMSYVWFWEWVRQDAGLQNELIGIGIPCSRELRNKIAHASMTDETTAEVRQYIHGLCSAKFTELLVKYFNDDLDALLSPDISVPAKRGNVMKPSNV